MSPHALSSRTYQSDEKPSALELELVHDIFRLSSLHEVIADEIDDSGEYVFFYS